MFVGNGPYAKNTLGPLWIGSNLPNRLRTGPALTALQTAKRHTGRLCFREGGYNFRQPKRKYAALFGTYHQ